MSAAKILINFSLGEDDKLDLLRKVALKEVAEVSQLLEICIALNHIDIINYILRELLRNFSKSEATSVLNKLITWCAHRDKTEIESLLRIKAKSAGLECGNTCKTCIYGIGGVHYADGL